MEGDTRVVIEKDTCYVAPVDKLPKPAQDLSQVLYGAGMCIVEYDLPPGKYRIKTAYLKKDECVLSIHSKMAHSSSLMMALNGTREAEQKDSSSTLRCDRFEPMLSALDKPQWIAESFHDPVTQHSTQALADINSCFEA